MAQRGRGVIYTPGPGGALDRLVEALGPLAAGFEIHHGLEPVIEYNHTSQTHPLPLGILVLPDASTLESVVDGFRGPKRFRLILVLPDWEPATLRLAHSLRPSYICRLEDDFKDLAEVTGRILIDCRPPNGSG